MNNINEKIDIFNDLSKLAINSIHPYFHIEFLKKSLGLNLNYIRAYKIGKILEHI